MGALYTEQALQLIEIPRANATQCFESQPPEQEEELELELAEAPGRKMLQWRLASCALLGAHFWAAQQPVEHSSICRADTG